MSEAKFGVRLVAHAKSDIQLKEGTDILGDVDSLLIGDGLHVLVERKRKVSTAVPAQIIEQVEATANAYKKLKKHIVGGKECRVASVVFAESFHPDAIKAFTDAGIYVLTLPDMKIHTPAAEPPGLDR